MKYAFGEFELNPATRELSRNGVPVALRPRSLECLVYLIEHRDRAVGRDELIAAVWGKVDAADTVVAQALLRLRKALDDTGSQQGMIRTLPRFGYRWVAPVREIATHGSDTDQLRDDSGQGYGAEVAFPGAGDVTDYAVTVGDTDAPQGDAGHSHTETVSNVVAHASAEDPASVARRNAPKEPRWLRFALPACIALLLAIGIGFLVHRHDVQPRASTSDTVLVMPVTVIPMDSESAWVRLGAMDYMATRLRGSGINVLPSEEALRLAAAMQGETPAAAREKLIALSGAHWIALPEMQRQDGAWTIRLRVLEARSERTIDGHGDTALAAAADAADAWLRQLGGQGKVGPPPGPLAERLHRIDAEILVGRLTEARRLVRSSSPDERGDPRFLLREGKLEFRTGNLDAAARCFQQALDRTTVEDQDTKIGALLGLGSVARARNDLDGAEQRYSQALALLGASPAQRVDARLMGLAYQGRGIVRAEHNDLDAAARDMGQARVWLQRSGDLVTLAVVGHNLGNVEALREDYVQAMREFDRSIDTFERFGVTDFLANSLHEKAEVQLLLARPAEASGTMRLADAQLPKLEDDGLAAAILLTKAKVQIALGQLRAAGASLADSRARGMPDADPRMLELRLRLHLARGEFAQAHALAVDASSAKDANGGLLLAAVQAALRARDPALAQAWLADAPQAAQVKEAGFASALAQALMDRAAGKSADALVQAEHAAAVLGVRESPDSEIQTGVLRAMVLLDTRQYGAASAILGELEKYSETDYRVAWVMSRLYQALGDRQALVSANGRAKALGGERDPSIEPAL